MNLITKVNKSSSKVSSFNLGRLDNVVNSNDTVEQPSQKLSKLELLKQQLNALNKENKEQLIYEIFAQDINLIIETEKEKITKNNNNIVAELLAKKAIEFEASNQLLMEEKTKTKTEELERLLELFAQKEFTILIDNEAQVVELIFSAVLALIEQSISDPKLISTVLTKLSEQLLDNNKPTLELNSAQFKLLHDLGVEEGLLNTFSLVENKDLLPCSYKLKLNAGSLESHLDEKLLKFKNLLINTYMCKEGE